MIRIVVDGIALQGRSRNRGIGRYVKSMVQALAADPKCEVHVLLIDKNVYVDHLVVAHAIDIWNLGISVHILRIGKEDSESIDSIILKERFIESLQPDLFIVADYFEAGMDFPVSIPAYPQILSSVILYDLIPYTDRTGHFISRDAEAKYLSKIRTLENADFIWCISDFSKQEATRLLPNLVSKLKFVGGGPGLEGIEFFKRKTDSVKKVEPYFISIGGDHPRKNLEGLVDAWSNYLNFANSKQFELVIVGSLSTGTMKLLNSTAQKAGANTKKLRFLGTPNDEDLIETIAASDGLIHPALEEGLGLPLLEAIALNIPVIGSSTTGMKELLTDLNSFDPYNLEEMAAKLIDLESSLDFKSAVLKNYPRVNFKFSWRSVVQNITDAIEDSRASRTSKDLHQLCLAVIAPSKNSMSGIGRFAFETNKQLAKYYKITEFDSEQIDPDDIETFLKFDRILVHLGNSPHNKNSFKLITNIPAHVLLHEVILDKTVLDERLSIMDPGDIKTIAANRFKNSETLTKILKLSTGVVVHSKDSRKIVRSSVPYKLPIYLQGHPVLAPVQEFNLESFIAMDTHEIYHFGNFNLYKSPEIILEALNLVVKTNQNIRFVIVGKIEENVEKIISKFEKNFAKYPIVRRGYLSSAELITEFSKASIAIQLRSDTHGESSGILPDLLSRGIPTIVSNIGSFGDLPDSVVIKVSPKCTATTLAVEIYALLQDTEKAEKLAVSANAFASENLAISTWALEMRNTIEDSYSKNLLVKYLADRPISEHKATVISQGIARNSFAGKYKSIGSDIGNLSKTNFMSGIQRVVIETHKRFDSIIDYSKLSFSGFCEPASQDSFDVFKDIQIDPLFHKPLINLSELDLVLLLDLNFNFPYERIKEIKQEKPLKVAVNIYDILPITNPEWFPSGASDGAFKPWLDKVLEVADVIFTNSKATAKEIANYSTNLKTPVDVLPLGAFSEFSPLPLPKFSDGIHLLYVSTLEPRKGHQELIKAFEILASRNLPVTLTLVGREGWDVGDLCKRIKEHSGLGKNLFWIQRASHQELMVEYEKANLIIAPSNGEGYGLTIDEALSFGRPVLARDIPVFRERKSKNLSYFSGGGLELATAISQLANSFQGFTIEPVRKLSDFADELLNSLSENLT